MNAPNISESEWAVMEVLWESSPRTASDVAKVLKDKTGWAENTVRTLLTRLVEKGAVIRSLQLRNMPLSEAIRYIAEVTKQPGGADDDGLWIGAE